MKFFKLLSLLMFLKDFLCIYKYTYSHIKSYNSKEYTVKNSSPSAPAS